MEAGVSVADTAVLWGCQIPSILTISVHKDQELLCLPKSSLCPQSNLPGVRQAQGVREWMPPSSNIPTSFFRCWYISTRAPLPLGRITLGLVLCSFPVFPLWSGSTAHGGDGLVMYPSFFFFPFSVLLPHFLLLFSGITSEINALKSLSSRRPKPSTTVVVHLANPWEP